MLVLTARCRAEGPDQVAEIIVQTASNGAAVDAAETDADLDVGEMAQFAASRAAASTPVLDQAPGAVAIGADGTELLGGSLYTGASVLGQVNYCRYGGVVYVGEAS